MSTVPFSFSRSEDQTETIVLLGENGVRVIPDTHVNYEQIREALLNGDEQTNVYALADATSNVENTLRRLSDRVTIRRDKIYFDGDEMESRLTRHIVAMVRNGDENYAGYVAFLENVQANPSKDSRKSLFKFLDKHDLVITEDGHFIGYKAVGSDGLSKAAGQEPVTVTLPDGTVQEHVGKIPNPVGATVEMPRSLVDPNRNAACSVGLHVGNHNYVNCYASSYAGDKFLTVKVNPRDVVSVPSDSNDEKIRTCRYVILEENPTRTRYEGTSYLEDEEDEEEPSIDPEEFFEDEYEHEDEESDSECKCCAEKEDPDDPDTHLDEHGYCGNCRDC